MQYFLQTFQRIQRNRQSRIRVKLSRRAGKRPDEILEEDIENSSICSPGSVVGHSISQSGSHLHQIQRYPVTSGSISTTHQPRSTSTPGMRTIKVMKYNCISKLARKRDLSYYIFFIHRKSKLRTR